MEAVAAVDISLNVVADTPFTIPPLIGRYYFAWQIMFRNSGTVASLTNAQYGLFTGPQASGVQVVAPGAALSAITSNSDNSAANFTNTSTTIMALRLASVPKLYLRITQVQSAGAAVDAVLLVRPLP